MAYYQITNNGEADYSSASLDLDAGLTTVKVWDTVPGDLNAAVKSEQLTIIKLNTNPLGNDNGGVPPGGGGIGVADTITNVAVGSFAASMSSQEIAISMDGLLPPGRKITNNTMGDIAIRCEDGEPAVWDLTQISATLQPGEFCYVAADYIAAITAICEIAVGTIDVETYY